MKKVFILLFLTYSYAHAQSVNDSLLVVGKPLPRFTLNEVKYFKKKKVTLDDFKGNWLILDCWNRYCSICLKKMPHIDSLQKEFKNQGVQFLLIGYTGSQYSKRTDEHLIKNLYERNRKEIGLNLSIAYDSLLFHQYRIGPCPYIIIVDPNGIVRGLTNNITAFQLKDLMLGKQVELNRVYTRKSVHLDN